MKLERLYAALRAADSLLGMFIHSGSYLHSPCWREDAERVREEVKAALAEFEKNE